MNASMEHAVCPTLLMLKIAAHANKPENQLPPPKRKRKRVAFIELLLKRVSLQLLSKRTEDTEAVPKRMSTLRCYGSACRR
jgi:hypothetical protein